MSDHIGDANKMVLRWCERCGIRKPDLDEACVCRECRERMAEPTTIDQWMEGKE